VLPLRLGQRTARLLDAHTRRCFFPQGQGDGAILLGAFGLGQRRLGFVDHTQRRYRGGRDLAPQLTFAGERVRNALAAVVFTGLMRCAVCGGGIVHFNKAYIGCANARNKGTCDNKGTMRRDDLEKAVLDGLQNRLMEPARTKIFCEEYARAMNRLHAEHNAQRAADAEALNKAERELARLVQALLDGVPASAVREKMGELEARRDALRNRLASREDSGVRFHPNMAEYYRAQVAGLRAVLTENGRQRQAADWLTGSN